MPRAMSGPTDPRPDSSAFGPGHVKLGKPTTAAQPLASHMPLMVPPRGARPSVRAYATPAAKACQQVTLHYLAFGVAAKSDLVLSPSPRRRRGSHPRLLATTPDVTPPAQALKTTTEDGADTTAEHGHGQADGTPPCQPPPQDQGERAKARLEPGLRLLVPRPCHMAGRHDRTTRPGQPPPERDPPIASAGYSSLGPAW